MEFGLPTIGSRTLSKILEAWGNIGERIGQRILYVLDTIGKVYVIT